MGDFDLVTSGTHKDFNTVFESKGGLSESEKLQLKKGTWLYGTWRSVKAHSIMLGLTVEEVKSLILQARITLVFLNLYFHIWI